jgi:cell wall-associated NlpC family hydrolase
MFADQYCGLPYKRRGRDREGLDCWGLVRLVLLEQAGKTFPRYDNDDPDGWSIAGHSNAFPRVKLVDAQALDVAIMFTDLKVKAGWVSAPVHIGVFVTPKHILHINAGGISQPDLATDLQISEIIRVK